MVCSPILFQHMNMALHDSTNNVIKDIFDRVSEYNKKLFLYVKKCLEKLM